VKSDPEFWKSVPEQVNLKFGCGVTAEKKITVSTWVQNLSKTPLKISPKSFLVDVTEGKKTEADSIQYVKFEREVINWPTYPGREITDNEMVVERGEIVEFSYFFSGEKDSTSWTFQVQSLPGNKTPRPVVCGLRNPKAN
jgi:hypothetical protein